jgi:hypothetical protein
MGRARRRPECLGGRRDTPGGRGGAKNALSRPLGRCDAPACSARLGRGCQDGANPCQSPRSRSSGRAGQRADGRHEPLEPEPGRPDSWGQLRERFAASGCPEIELRLDRRLSPGSAGPEDRSKRRWWPREASRCRSSGASDRHRGATRVNSGFRPRRRGPRHGDRRATPAS